MKMPNSLSLQPPPPRLTFVVCCLLFPPPPFFLTVQRRRSKGADAEAWRAALKTKKLALWLEELAQRQLEKIQFVPALHRQVSGRQEVREGVGKVLRRVSKRNKTLRTDGNDFLSIRIFIHILKKNKKRFLSDYFLKIHVMWNECMKLKQRFMRNFRRRVLII